MKYVEKHNFGLRQFASDPKQETWIIWSSEGSQFPWKSEQLVWANVQLLQAILPKNVLEQDEMGETCIAPTQCSWSALDIVHLRVTFWME